jgi:Zn-finger nucleic acid-binding protein
MPTPFEPKASHVGICPICDVSFALKPSRDRRAEHNYCSPACAGKARRKNRPPKNELVNQLQLHANFVAIGRLYGVSDNAVRQWCREYGLSTKSADWRRAK